MYTITVINQTERTQTLLRDYSEIRENTIEGFLLIKRNSMWTREFCYIEDGKFHSQRLETKVGKRVFVCVPC